MHAASELGAHVAFIASDASSARPDGKAPDTPTAPDDKNAPGCEDSGCRTITATTPVVAQVESIDAALLVIDSAPDASSIRRHGSRPHVRPPSVGPPRSIA
jgi:hypothetical protein